MLVPDPDRLLAGATEPGSDMDDAVERVAALVAAALPLYGYSLVPVVVVGRDLGADLAAHLVLKYNHCLAAAILLRPTRTVPPVPVGTLNGVHILLAGPAHDEPLGSVGGQIRDVMVRGGAVVVSERVVGRRAMVTRETVISRVFLSTLFG